MKESTLGAYDIADLRKLWPHPLIVKGILRAQDAVLIGRAPLYGTAVGGQAGAARAIEIFRDEIDRLLALIGCRSVAELDREYLV